MTMGKIENETFNVLKTRGYNLEHNFGPETNHRIQLSGRDTRHPEPAGLRHAYRLRGLASEEWRDIMRQFHPGGADDRTSQTFYGRV